MKKRARQTRVAVARMNLVDRVVSYFAPSSGLERLKARTLLGMSAEGGYKGGKRDRRASRGWHPGEGSADVDLLPELRDLRGRSRDLARNMPIATGAISTNVGHVVGGGLVPMPKIDHEVLGISPEEAATLGRQAENEWTLFARSVDFTRVQHESELEGLVYRAVLESGDVFGVRRYRKDPGDTYGTKVQIVEADRVCNENWRADRNNLAGGVQIDGNGVPVAYWMTNRHPGSFNAGGLTWRAVPARYSDGRPVVLHLFDRLRPEQSRGIPYLAPVIEALKELGEYTDAEVRAAVVSAYFTVFVKKPLATDEGPLPTQVGGAAASGSDSDEVELGPGAIVDLAEGEDVVIANPGRPNPQIDAFLTSILRQIGVALELPFEVLIKHFTSSYTAGRAALEMAYFFWRRRRGWLARNWCQQLYTWMWEEAVATGRLLAPGFFTDPLKRQAYLAAEWIGPTRISLDPLKDAKADDVDLTSGATDLQTVRMQRTGGDWKDGILQRGREVRLMREEGIEAPAKQDAPAMPAEPDNDEDATT
jgi:lambda family phage portal protein